MKILEVGILDFLPMPWQMSLIVISAGIIVMLIVNLLIRKRISDARKRAPILLVSGVATAMLCIFTVGYAFDMSLKKMLWNVLLLIPICLVSPVLGKNNSQQT